jgi:ATP-dependent RNA helicase DDX19/DBP5
MSVTTASTSSSQKWSDLNEEAEKDPVEAVTKELSNAAVEGKEASAAAVAATPAGEEAAEEVPLTVVQGLHPNDKTAEVSIIGLDPAQEGIYKSAETFEALGLSKELLNGVYDLKFTQPSKIQAQALPIILAKERPNLIGQAHAGSGKTATFSLGVLSRIDENKASPQAVVVVPVRELAIQVHEVMQKLAKFTKVTFHLAVAQERTEQKSNQPREKQGNVSEHVVIGTPGTIEGMLKHRRIDARTVQVMVVDEADQMIAQQGGQLTDTTIKIKGYFPKAQILLFSATFDPAVRTFAKITVPKAVEIIVKTEELSLDNIKQFWMNCRDDQHKYTVLTMIFALLEIGQSIIFVRTVATAKQLSAQMRKDGYKVSLLHGRDMVPSERDKVMNDFRNGQTSVLITTNVLARGIDVLSVTLVVNFDIPTNKFNRADPETYIHRIGRSGRFGRKGVAINFVHDGPSRGQLQSIAQHFNKNIQELPTDEAHLEKTSEIIKAALK